MLHRAGWDVLVLERAGDSLSGRGAGIVTHPELFACLEAAGIIIDDRIGVSIPGRVTLGRDGSLLQENAHPQILTAWGRLRSEEHTSELQSLMRISYAVFCLKKNIGKNTTRRTNTKIM